MAEVNFYRLARNTPLVRGLTHTECPYHTGSVIENRLGLQIGKVIDKHLAWCLRGSHVAADVKNYTEVMSREGVLSIPNFLAENEFQRVREEFARAQSRLVYAKVRNAQMGKLEVAKFSLSDENDDFPYTIKCLQQNRVILQIASAVIRRPISSKPSLTINVHRMVDSLAVDNDIENILHADLHTPTVKAFFYLNDVNEANGAFIYAKGSHKFSLSRLRYEYDISVRTAKLKRGDSDIPEHLLNTRGFNKRNIVSEKCRRSMKIVEKSICGKANTLVIANNMGFHRKGEFTDESARETILLNFRHLERPFR